MTFSQGLSCTSEEISSDIRWPNQPNPFIPADFHAKKSVAVSHHGFVVAVQRVRHCIEPRPRPQDPVTLKSVAWMIARLKSSKISHSRRDVAALRWLSEILAHSPVQLLVTQVHPGRSPAHTHVWHGSFPELDGTHKKRSPTEFHDTENERDLFLAPLSVKIPARFLEHSLY